MSTYGYVSQPRRSTGRWDARPSLWTNVLPVLFVGLSVASFALWASPSSSKGPEAPCRRTAPGHWDCTDPALLSTLKAAAMRQAPAPEPAPSLTVVTAYNSVPGQTDSTPCVAADGSDICRLLEKGERTCAANAYAFGTRLNVPGVGTCVVHDRMAQKYGDRVDVYMGGSAHVAEARSFGRQSLNVTVIE